MANAHDPQRGTTIAAMPQPDGDETLRLRNPAADVSDTSFERTDIGYEDNAFVVDSKAGPSGGTVRPIHLRTAGVTRLSLDGSAAALRAALTCRKITAPAVADIACTVTKRLAETGTITTVAGASLLDSDYFTLKDGINNYVFEFDSDGAVTPGRTAVPYTALLSANEVRDAIITAVNASPITMTASSGGAATVNLAMDYSTGGETNTENVANAGFAVTGMAAPTGATSWGYLVTSVMADGTETAGTATSIADGAATLNASNDNLITWTPNADADIVSQNVYRPTAAGTPSTTGLIATLSPTATRFVDTGVVATGVVPTTNTSGVITATSVAAPTSGAIITATSKVVTPAVETGPGATLYIRATPMTAALATVAGIDVSIDASDATTGTSTPGAAAGGDVNITAGDAKRYSSGNANGGNVNIAVGAPIGTGAAGKVIITGVVESTGDATVTGDVVVTGDLTVNTNLDVDGDATVNGSLAAASGAITAGNLTATALATPVGTSVTPVLTQTASITTVAGAVLVDGDYFTVNDGTTAYVFEFDNNAAVTGGRIPVTFVGTEDADAVRDLVISAVNGTAIVATATSGGAATVTLAMDVPGVAGGSLSENVTDGGFAVSSFADPTHVTTQSYKVVALLDDGAHTAASAEFSTATGHATLSAQNYNTVLWGAVTGAKTYDVYRTVGGVAQGRIATGLTVLTLNDTGLAAVVTTAPTTNTTGVIRGTASVGIAGVTAAATGGLSASDSTGTLVTNYGQVGENTQTLPAAAAGLNLIFVISTAGAGAVHVKAGASDKIYLDGVALDDGDKASLAVPAVGNTLTCLAFQTGAAAWDWTCTSGGGSTWTDGGA